MTQRTLITWLFVVATGCGPNVDRAPVPDSTSTAAARETSVARPDSSLIVATRPTLIVFYRGAYTAADSGGDNAETLGDQQYHLGSARPALDSLGVTIQERYGERIDYMVDGAAHRFVPARDSGRAAYLFVSPGMTAQSHYGVLSDLDVVREARTRFKLAALKHE